MGLSIIHHLVWGTAEALDKNRLRIFQPTLGFLSAIGGKYGNYERGYPQVLHGFVLKGFIWWGFCQFILAWYWLGCKGGGGKKKKFRLRKVFSGFGRPKQGSTSKSSQGQPPRSGDLQWVWLVSSWSCGHQPWWPCKGWNLPGAASCLSSAWKFRGT